MRSKFSNLSPNVRLSGYCFSSLEITVLSTKNPSANGFLPVTTPQSGSVYHCKEKNQVQVINGSLQCHPDRMMADCVDSIALRHWDSCKPYKLCSLYWNSEDIGQVVWRKLTTHSTVCWFHMMYPILFCLHQWRNRPCSEIKEPFPPVGSIFMWASCNRLRVILSRLNQWN